MKRLRRLWILCGLLLLTTCARNVLEINTGALKSEVAPRENITFTFTKAVATDSMLNRWDTTQFVQLQPRVAGRFKWVKANELVFSPIEGFAPSTEYSVRLGKALEKVGKKVALNKEQKLSFRTTLLQFEKAEAFWVKNDQNTPQLRLNLKFNHKVKQKNIASLISARVGEQAVQAMRVLGAEPSNTVEVLLEEGGALTLSGQALQLTMQAGIACAESDYKTPSPANYTVQVPDIKKLTIQRIETGIDKARPMLKVLASQSISLEQLKANVKVEPRLVYEIQPFDGGFILKGFFKQGESYNIKFSEKLEGVLGARLGNDYEQMVTFKEEQPYIQFSEKRGSYLSNAGSRNIGLHINQVPQITVKIYRIYENNLQHFLREMGGYRDYEQDGEYNFSNYADVIFSRDYLTKQLPLVDGKYVFTLDNQKLKDNKGLFYVYIHSTENQWLKDSKLISLSDIGFIVRETKDDMLVFTNSLLTTQPLPNLPVQIISRSNQIIATQNTDEHGVAVFKHIKRKHPEADVRLITAQSKNDYNFIYLNGTNVDKSDFETGGKFETESGYQAFMYGERDLYRPGETINLNALVRTRDWKPVGEMPAIFRLEMPNGKNFTTRKVTLNAQGACPVSVKLPANAITGTYRASIETTTGEVLERMNVSVEEFMPDRIKVLLSFLENDRKSDKKGEIVPGDSLRVLLRARNLFGPPAIGKNFQMEFNLNNDEFKPKTFADYSFRLDRRGEENVYFNPENELENRTTEGKTDGQGNYYQAFHLPKSLEYHGILYGYVLATVFDETGRGVTRSRGFNLITQPYMLGIKRGLHYGAPKEPMNIGLIAVKADETATSGRAIVRIYQHKWQNTLERAANSEEMRYVSQKKLVKVSEQEIEVDAAGANVAFTPQEVGEYEVRVSLPDGGTFVKQHFLVYSPVYAGSGNAFPIDKKGRVEIKMDKLDYKIGDEAKILFTTPFNGKMLVTVERMGVFSHQYVEVRNRMASITLKMKEEYLPNVYITATLFKPVTDGVIPLTVAHGFANITLKEPSTRLDVKIDAVARTQTHQKQTIKVSVSQLGAAAQGAEVTLAVVDEGILQIKNYETPNAHREFYTKRALQVSAYDLYPRLFPEFAIGQKSTGGDGFELQGRANPMVNRRVKLVSFWSGVLPTNGGEASFTIDVPQFSGSLRIMALAYKDGAFGHAEQNMIVADPIVVSTGFPRFLSPQDRVTVPVTLFNTTKEDATAQIRINTTNALEIRGKDTQTLEVKAGSEDEVKFEIEAKNIIDSAKVSIEVQGGGRTFVEEIFVNVRPVTGLVKHFQAGEIAPNSTANITLPTDLIESSARGKLVVSRSPLVQFANNFEYLVQYPYGCVEQITSGAFPQLYVQELLQTISPEKQNLDILQSQARFYVQEAIYKLQSMQTYSGGLSYWTGASETHSFGTVYAAHFLLEAQKLGYQIDQNVLDAMLAYIKNLSDDDVNYEYIFRDASGKRFRKKIAKRQSIYALYVLTLANRENLPVMNYYKENTAQLAIDSKYLLASAFQLLGDQSAAKTILPAAFVGEREEQAFNDAFSSPIRDEALALNALIEADEHNLQIPTLARQLSDALRGAKFLNTQENAFILLSLGKLARKMGTSQAVAQVLQGGAPVANGADITLVREVIGKSFQVQASNGAMYYYWQAQGLSASGKVENLDNKIKVRRAFYDREGNIIKSNKFRQNDLVVVKISIVSDNGVGEVPNVAITDMLPAGFEIENPRLTVSREIPWIRNRAMPENTDMRDDRLNIFTSAGAKVKNFYYLVRAVSIGKFQLGTTSADAMYNGEYRSYYGGGSIQIIDREEDNK